jgi:hypothetical protein
VSVGNATQDPFTVGTYLRPPQHRLSTMLTLGNERTWSLYLNGSVGVDRRQNTFFTEGRARLGGPWQGRVRFTRTQYGTLGYQDIETALVRDFSGREVALFYSTTLKRFQLDLTGARF